MDVICFASSQHSHRTGSGQEERTESWQLCCNDSLSTAVYFCTSPWRAWHREIIVIPSLFLRLSEQSSPSVIYLSSSLERPHSQDSSTPQHTPLTCPMIFHPTYCPSSCCTNSIAPTGPPIILLLYISGIVSDSHSHTIHTHQVTHIPLSLQLIFR